jgi:hypothetical protein
MGDKPLHDKHKPYVDHKNRRIVVPGTVIATTLPVKVVGSDQIKKENDDEAF